MVKSGSTLYYVDATGKMTKVTAKADEVKGLVTVVASDGSEALVTSFNLFNTETAANIASVNRLPNTVKSGSGNFIR